MRIAPFHFLLIGLAAYRAARFITIDTLPVVRRPREWVERKFPEGHWFSELISCPFCVSAYTSAGALALWFLAGDAGRLLVTFGAVWGLTALAFAALDKD